MPFYEEMSMPASLFFLRSLISFACFSLLELLLDFCSFFNEGLIEGEKTRKRKDAKKCSFSLNGRANWNFTESGKKRNLERMAWWAMRKVRHNIDQLRWKVMNKHPSCFTSGERRNWMCLQRKKGGENSLMNSSPVKCFSDLIVSYFKYEASL